MSIAAVGAIGGIGIGSLGGMNLARQPSPIQTLGLTPSPSTKVDLSGAAQSSLVSDGQQSQSMSELAQALIIALMMAMIQGN